MDQQDAVRDVLAYMPANADLLPRVYRRAADDLEQLGWCQRSFTRERKRCVSHAVLEAARFRSTPCYSYLPCVCGLCHERERAYMIGMWAGAALEAWVGEPIIAWNDRETRTAQEVTKTLRALADFLDAVYKEKLTSEGRCLSI